MKRRIFIKNTTMAGTGLIFAGSLNSCVGSYNPKIINAVWNEKFVFDAPQDARRIRQLVRCAVMAPSGHNTQPWFFRINANRIEILPDLSRRLPVADRDNRELFISLGAALQNILISASKFGFTTEYEIDESGGGRIIIYLSDKINYEKNKWFEAMLSRQTTRNEYEKKSLPSDFFSELQRSTDPDTAFYFTSEKDEFATFIDFVKEGNRLLYNNKKYLEELKEWIRWNDKEAEEKLDGLYARALGQPSTAAWFGKMIFNLTVTEKNQNKDDENFINSSSGLLFLFSEDGIKNWVESGRKLEQILISITKQGLKYAFHNQPCQALPLRSDFAHTFDYKGLMPQAAIRIGYGDSLPRSPRRRINDVILS
jgi:hypothetical protein